MKILIGSHGTGKTTLLKEVSTRFPDYYVTDGFSRPVIKIGKMLELSNDEKQYAINELSAWAYQNYLTHKNVISTRSLVDCIIYSAILTPNVNTDMSSKFVFTFLQFKHSILLIANDIYWYINGLYLFLKYLSINSSFDKYAFIKRYFIKSSSVKSGIFLRIPLLLK